MRVLVLEDDAVLACQLRDAFTVAGYAVDLAGNATQVYVNFAIDQVAPGLTVTKRISGCFRAIDEVQSVPTYLTSP